MQLRELHPKVFFLETWQALDAEAAEERRARSAAGRGYDYRPLIAFVFGTIFIVLMESYGMPDDFRRLVLAMQAEPFDATDFWTQLYHSPYWELYNHLYWAGWRVLGFLLLPMLIIKATGQRLRDQGLSTKGFFEHLWFYVLALVVVLGCVVAVSYTESYSSYYPFHRQAHRSWVDLLSWEIAYLLQFLSLEFFFRGWWLSATKAMMGSHAIYAMIVPYVMIHIGKPTSETFSAILAGIFLGTLAMRTKSIWSGFLIHVSVAWAMDLAALLQTTGLPERWAQPPTPF